MKSGSIVAALFAAVVSGACSNLQASPSAPTASAAIVASAGIVSSDDARLHPDPHFPAPSQVTPAPAAPIPASPSPTPPPAAPVPCGCLIVHVESATTHQPVYRAEVNFAERPMVYTDQSGIATFAIGYGGTARLIVYHGEYQMHDEQVPLKEEIADWTVRLLPLR